METRKSYMLVGWVAMIVTFGSLYAFAGDKYFAKRHSCGFDKEHCVKQMHSGDRYQQAERPAVKTGTIQ